MSNHYIGELMTHMVDQIMNLHIKGHIERDPARVLLFTARIIVGMEDGNEYEAFYTTDNCVCGACLRRLKRGERIYPIAGVSDKNNQYRICSDIMEGKATDGIPVVTYKLCTQCFDQIYGKYYNNPEAGPLERKYIEEHCSEEEYTVQNEFVNRYKAVL